MMRLILFAMMVMCIGKVSAALPPFSESKREIVAILSDEAIYQHIPSGDTIQQIVRTSPGYLIITSSRVLPVSIRYIPRHNLGPAKFSIRFHKPVETGANIPGRQEATEDYRKKNEEIYWQNRH